MKTFQELVDAGWGGRHLDPMAGACPGCGAGELVIVEDIAHDLKRFCHRCDRCWSVEGTRLAPRRSRAVPGMSATSALLRSIPARRAAMGNLGHPPRLVRVG